MTRSRRGLDQMNVRVHRAVSDLDGVTGMAILRADRRATDRPLARRPSLQEAYDQEIQRQLAQMTPAERCDVDAPPPAKATKAKAMRTRGDDPLRHALYRVSGVDLTSIDALGVETLKQPPGIDGVPLPSLSHSPLWSLASLSSMWASIWGRRREVVAGWIRLVDTLRAAVFPF
jgi:hypothetical protein